MTALSHHFVTCQNLEIHYTAWGERSAPLVILWHGLTRTGRDFDELAAALSDQFYVVCPDTPGRGLSQWCSDPATQYTVPFYAQLALNLMETLDVAHCDWVGTSMGGLIGILTASLAPERMRRLVINDVAPEVPQAALARIRDYVGLLPEFQSMAELQAWLQQIYAPFGDNTAAFWQRMALTSARRKEDGRLTLHYDPQLAVPFMADNSGDLWAQWGQIACPTLVLRGALSDLLTPALAQRMLDTNKQAQLETIADVGHAPTLANAEQIALVKGFLTDQYFGGH